MAVATENHTCVGLIFDNKWPSLQPDPVTKDVSLGDSMV